MVPGHPSPNADAAADAARVREIAAGSQEALAELHDRFAPMLLGLARKIVGGREDAEEVVQEVFVHVWRQAARYDGARSSVATWLVLVARSRAIDRLRARNVVERAHAGARDEASDHASAEGATRVLHRERRRRVRAALAEVPAEQREVLELAFYGGLTQREIAERTAIPLGTVKTRTLLAMKKLRAALRDEIRELL